MGSLIRGILVGIGLGFLIAPMRGQEMRRLLSQRFQELRNSLPEGSQVNQYTQQISQSATEGAGSLKNYAQQATAQVKETASSLGNIAQQAASSAKDTASNLGGIAQNAGSDAKSAASDLASKAQDVVQQTTSNVKNTASDLGSKVQDVAQQAASTAKNAASTAQATAQQTVSTAKDVASNVTNAAQTTAQQTVANAKDTASNVADATQTTAQQTASKAKDAASTVANTAQKTGSSQSTATTTTQTTAPSLQNVQPVTSGATITGASLSSIPGIEPEIQGKLEAQGISTTQQLLEQASSKDERTTLSQKAGVSTHMLKTLADRADLMRIQGVNADVATMLEEAGVAGSKDLRRRNPEHLYATLKEAQESGNNAYNTPGIDQLTQWIADAMALTSSSQE